jgi:ribonuclease Z
MRPRFHPRLINGPFDDPGLFIPFLFENRAILFDAGDLTALSSRDILKTSHVFVSHTHMDHFIGFDRLLRLFLGREKNLYMYGPQGFLKNVEGKLAGYSWNLVNSYNYPLRLIVSEVRPDGLITRDYPCRDKFLPRQKPGSAPFSEELHAEDSFKVTCTVLEHRIACLAFCIHERFHVNINKEALQNLNLDTGPWLTTFKKALYSRTDPDSTFKVKIAGTPKDRTFELGRLAEQIAIITPGQKIAYVTDAVYNDANIENITDFARNADHLFIEAAFLDKDRNMAMEKCHLTARQAGELAARANAEHFTIFHFSPRYLGQEDLLYQEASKAFEYYGNLSR